MTEIKSSTGTPLVKYAIVPGFPAHRVGDDGSVWSRLSRGGKTRRSTAIWTRLKGSPQKHGHILVCFGNKHYDFVHRLVLLAFEGPCPEGMECLHGDGDPGNNRLDNLRWGTHSENGKDTIRHGRSNKGERAPSAKLTATAVLQIMAAVEAGVPREDIASVHGCSVFNIKAIARGESWNHITGLSPYVPRSSRPGRRPKTMVR